MVKNKCCEAENRKSTQKLRNFQLVKHTSSLNVDQTNFRKSIKFQQMFHFILKSSTSDYLLQRLEANLSLNGELITDEFKSQRKHLPSFYSIKFKAEVIPSLRCQDFKAPLLNLRLSKELIFP